MTGSMLAWGAAAVWLLAAQAAPAPSALQVPAGAGSRPERTFRADTAIACTQCDQWNERREPFRVFANTYYVGTGGLGAVLITSDSGHILLDGALPQSAPIIDANIRALGFRTEDVRLIVNSHVHFDHAGGIAALQRASGARVAASPASARALEQGRPTDDDPQAPSERYAPVKGVQVIRDGETLRVGSLALTAHFTPGHTPGGTSWTWRSCEGTRCLDIVYADSLNAVSNDRFRFTGDRTHASLVDSFKRSVQTVAALPCDILLSVHPDFSDLWGKVQRRAEKPDADPFIDPQGCRTYAANAMRALDRRIADEQSAPVRR
jgi:metallo-beta-lactamase class B